MRKLLYTILLLAGAAQAQVWDVPCPNGSNPQGQTTNPVNGHLRAWLCVDTTTGSITSPSITATLPSGAIFLILSGSCPAGTAEVSALNGKMLRGTVAANGDVGTTGGSVTITPAGTVSQPIFAGNAFTSVINHTHTVSVTDPGHTHVINATTYVEQAQGGTTASTTGTHLMTSASTGGSLRSSAQTTVSKAPTEASQVTGISASTANPAGGVASITPTGTVSQPTFTGNAVDPSPSFVRVIFCSAN